MCAELKSQRVCTWQLVQVMRIRSGWHRSAVECGIELTFDAKPKRDRSLLDLAPTPQTLHPLSDGCINMQCQWALYIYIYIYTYMQGYTLYRCLYTRFIFVNPTPPPPYISLYIYTYLYIIHKSHSDNISNQEFWALVWTQYVVTFVQVVLLPYLIVQSCFVTCVLKLFPLLVRLQKFATSLPEMCVRHILVQNVLRPFYF